MRLNHGLLVSLALLPFAASCRSSEAPPAHENPSLIHQRLWLERIPKDPTEMVHAFGVFEEGEPGFFAKASRYKFTVELFRHELTRDRLAIRFPQDGRRATMRFHIERCSDVREADLCLEVDENPWGGPRKYYGLKTRRAHELLPELVAMTPPER